MSGLYEIKSRISTRIEKLHGHLLLSVLSGIFDSIVALYCFVVSAGNSIYAELCPILAPIPNFIQIARERLKLKRVMPVQIHGNLSYSVVQKFLHLLLTSYHSPISSPPVIFCLNRSSRNRHKINHFALKKG